MAAVEGTTVLGERRPAIAVALISAAISVAAVPIVQSPRVPVAAFIPWAQLLSWTTCASSCASRV